MWVIRPLPDNSTRNRFRCSAHGNQRGRMWQKSFVRHLLTTPTVIGTLVPFVTESVDNVRRPGLRRRLNSTIRQLSNVRIGIRCRQGVPHGLPTIGITFRRPASQPIGWPIAMPIL